MHKRHAYLFVLVLLYLVGGIAFGETHSQNTFSSYSVIRKRNIFRPLWKVSERKEKESNKYALDAMKKAEEERRKQIEESEAKRRLKRKKQQLEREYKLTGIVFEEGKQQAVIQNTRGTTYFVKENENIKDLKVVSINSSKAEVELDYERKFGVVLHME